jgi:hypothetical protein
MGDNANSAGFLRAASFGYGMQRSAQRDQTW